MSRTIELHAGPAIIAWLGRAFREYAERRYGGAACGECDQAAKEALRQTAEHLTETNGARLSRRGMAVYRAAVEFALRSEQPDTSSGAETQRRLIEQLLSGEPVTDQQWADAQQQDLEGNAK